MRFTELLREIQATYPKHSRKYHVLATRYYLDVESLEELSATANHVNVARVRCRRC